MPIIDHFSPQVRAISHYSFLSQCVGNAHCSRFEPLLPNNFVAEPNIQIGSRIEIDVQADELLTAN